MATYRDEQILLTKLKLDHTNPRHPEFESQREIIEWMTYGAGRIGEKLATLAKDIVEFGLNPADRAMVVADEKEKGHYIVLEGNRRLTAVKLLNNPDLAPDKKWKKRFARLVSQGYTPTKVVNCVVFDDEELAYHFIELRHLGESGGAGIVPWEPEQKARHDQKMHGRSRHHKALAILDFVRTADGVEEDTRNYAGEGFPITTLDRLLSDKEFRTFLGLDLNSDGEICFGVEPRQALKPIGKVINDFGSGNSNVRDVINKEKRDEYKTTFTKDSVADHSKALPKPVRVVDALSGKARKGPRSKGRYRDPRDRRFIVIPGTILAIDAKDYNRARRVFEELRTIEVRGRNGKPHFANAGILLLRLFIEMSVDLYLTRHKLEHTKNTGWINVSLNERTKVVLGNLESKNALNPQESKVITKALGDVGKVSNPNSLNDFAHNPNQIPHPHDLFDVWDQYTKFLQAVWDNMK